MSMFHHLGKPFAKANPHQATANGKRFKFHGRFSDKAVAVAKERRTPNAFIIEKELRGETYYLVVTEK